MIKDDEGCPKEEYYSKQMDEAEKLDEEPRPGAVPVYWFSGNPHICSGARREEENEGLFSS